MVQIANSGLKAGCPRTTEQQRRRHGANGRLGHISEHSWQRIWLYMFAVVVIDVCPRCPIILPSQRDPAQLLHRCGRPLPRLVVARCCFIRSSAYELFKTVAKFILRNKEGPEVASIRRGGPI